jgi:catalase
LPLSGATQQSRIAKTQNFQQAGDFDRSLTATEQANLVSNLAGDLGAVKDDGVKYTMASYFHKADAGYGRALAAALRLDGARVATLAGKLTN